MKKTNQLKKKALLLVLLTSAVFVAKAQTPYVEGWKEIHTGVAEHLYDVACLNGNEVVACGENGKVLKSTDGGETWSVMFEKQGIRMIHVAFADEHVGYICSNEGALFKTIDGGQTWQELSTAVTVDLDCTGYDRLSHMFVVDAETFYLVDLQTEIIWKTSDGGETFSYYDDFWWSFSHINHCELFFEGDTGFLVAVDADYLYVLKTTDAGTTWGAVYKTVCDDYSVVTHFFDKNHVEILGSINEGSHNMIVTDDGFENVELRHDEACPQLGTVTYAKFTSDTYGCLLTGLTLVKGSTSWGCCVMKDGWENWIETVQSLPSCVYQGTTQCQDLYAMDGVDTTFFVVSENGLIYKSAMIPVNSISEDAISVNIYPNPALEMISVEGVGVMDVKLFNTLGQLVKTAHNTNEINLHDLSQGVYLVRVTLHDGTTFTDKVVKE